MAVWVRGDSVLIALSLSLLCAWEAFQEAEKEHPYTS